MFRTLRTRLANASPGARAVAVAVAVEVLVVGPLIALFAALCDDVGTAVALATSVAVLLGGIVGGRVWYVAIHDDPGDDDAPEATPDKPHPPLVPSDRPVTGPRPRRGLAFPQFIGLRIGLARIRGFPPMEARPDLFTAGKNMHANRHRGRLRARKRDDRELSAIDRLDGFEPRGQRANHYIDVGVMAACATLFPGFIWAVWMSSVRSSDGTPWLALPILIAPLLGVAVAVAAYTIDTRSRARVARRRDAGLVPTGEPTDPPSRMPASSKLMRDMHARAASPLRRAVSAAHAGAAPAMVVALLPSGVLIVAAPNATSAAHVAALCIGLAAALGVLLVAIGWNLWSRPGAR